MRILLIGLLTGLAFCPAKSQTLVSSTYLGSKTQSQLLGQFNNLLLIHYGAKYYRIAYTTPDVHGVTDTVTGLLAVPDYPYGKYPKLVYQHGTSGSRLDVPSVNYANGEGQVGLLFAGLGYVAFLPDYLGLGPLSQGIHPYVHAASEAWTALDMLRATSGLVENLPVATNDQLFVTGYSQGGHAAMALARAIENDPAQEFTLTAAAPMSGPYSISGVMRDLILSDDIYYYPGYIPNTAESYQSVYGNLFQDETGMFRQPYADMIRAFRLGQTTLSDLNQALVDTLEAREGASRPFRMLQPNLVQAVMNDPQHPVNQALAANDTYNNWTPRAPLRLFYCMADDQVPYRNSLVARDSLSAAGAPDFQIADVMPNANHGQCFVPAITSTIIFFSGFQQIGTVETTNPKPAPLQIAPNPVQDVLYVSGLSDSGCMVEILDAWGQMVKSMVAPAGALEVRVGDLAKGVYWVRVKTGVIGRAFVKID